MPSVFLFHAADSDFRRMDLIFHCMYTFLLNRTSYSRKDGVYYVRQKQTHKYNKNSNDDGNIRKTDLHLFSSDTRNGRHFYTAPPPAVEKIVRELINSKLLTIFCLLNGSRSGHGSAIFCTRYGTDGWYAGIHADP